MRSSIAALRPLRQALEMGHAQQVVGGGASQGFHLHANVPDKFRSRRLAGRLTPAVELLDP